MAIFNPLFFSYPLIGLSTSFGIPTCILDLSLAALEKISPGILSDIAKAAQEGKNAARKAISSIVNDLLNEFGLLDYDIGSGKLALFSSSSKFGMDLSILETLSKINSYLSEIESLYQQGDALYAHIKDCLGAFETAKKASVTGGTPPSHTDNLEYANSVKEARLEIARQEVEECDTCLNNVGTALLNISAAQQQEQEDTSPIFRLVFGPPVSKQGIFILSENGLYYNSQTRDYGGRDLPSPSDIGFVFDSEKWKMDHAPSLGGKGTLVSYEDVDKYVGTIFDINSVDNSKQLTSFYDKDHFLNVIKEQKDKMVYDTSAQVGSLLSQGYLQDSALVTNHRQNIYSIIACK